MRKSLLKRGLTDNELEISSTGNFQVRCQIDIRACAD